MKSEMKIWLVALGFVALYGGIVVWAYPLFSSDVACRYAPMADEFARGNWELAFHPRFGVLFQVLAGSLVSGHSRRPRLPVGVRSLAWAVGRAHLVSRPQVVRRTGRLVVGRAGAAVR